MRVVESNVRVGSGEIDLVAMDGDVRTVVEVRTTVGSVDPIDAVDQPKRHRVTRLARTIGADRVDFVGVRVDVAGVDVHWLPGVT